MPESRLGIGTVGRKNQHRARDGGALLDVGLRFLYRPHPTGAFGMAVGHFPVGVEHPFALEDFQQASGIRRTVLALHRQLRKKAAGGRDGRDEDALHEPAEIPIEERAVQHEGIDGSRRTLAEIIGSNQPARGMGHQDDFRVSLFADGCQGGIEVCKILLQVFAEKSILVGPEGTAVFPQIEGIKVVAPGQTTIAQLCLEEIVVVSVEIKDGPAAAIAGERFPDQGANDFAFIVIGHLEGTGLVAVAQQIGSVLRPKQGSTTKE